MQHVLRETQHVLLSVSPVKSMSKKTHSLGRPKLLTLEGVRYHQRLPDAYRKRHGAENARKM